MAGAVMASIKDWPRGWRLSLYVIGMSVILLILIPLFILAGAYVMGFGECSKPDAAAAVCSPFGQFSLAVVLIASGFLAFLPLTRILQRTLAVELKPQPSALTASSLPVVVGGQNRTLQLGQELIVGRMESSDSSGRTILFEGNVLTLWSLYPFQKGWIKQGDELVLVFQRVPPGNLKFALAFWNGSPNPVRGVAAITQSLSVVLAMACIVVFVNVPAPFPALWITVCAVSATLSSTYLALMLRAKFVLRRFVTDLNSQ